jgi:putative transcriptional regulator
MRVQGKYENPGWRGGTSGTSMTLLPALRIKALREKCHVSQAVFANYLNLTADYVSKLERGEKRPTGSALVLLDVIRRKGIEAIL